MQLSNKKHFTVTELNNRIKNLIEGSFNFVSVKGEVSQIKKHASGHIYFTLKDEKDSISSVCWRFNVIKQKIVPKDGDMVIIDGRISTYSPQSKYQLIVEKIEYEGEGSLLKKFEETKQKLLKEGFFDKSLKKKIPFLPNKVCIITSPSGSVIRDIIHRIKDRFPLEIILYPVVVQGKNAVSQIKSALSSVNFKKKTGQKNFINIDVIILARGGGSLEDMMCFNSEELVKSIYYSKIPIITAIGHETDITLCDFASDLSAPTPTAAAEFLVPVREDLLIRLKEIVIRLTKGLRNNTSLKKMNSQNLFLKIPKLQNFIESKVQSLDLLDNRLKNSIQNTIKEKNFLLQNILNDFQPIFFKKQLIFYIDKIKGFKLSLDKDICNYLRLVNYKLDEKSKLLKSMSYKKVLKRGYSVTRYNEKIIKNASEIPNEKELNIEFFSSEMFAKKIKK